MTCYSVISIRSGRELYSGDSIRIAAHKLTYGTCHGQAKTPVGAKLNALDARNRIIAARIDAMRKESSRA